MCDIKIDQSKFSYVPKKLFYKTVSTHSFWFNGLNSATMADALKSSEYTKPIHKYNVGE
jgi:hypothetical protein